MSVQSVSWVLNGPSKSLEPARRFVLVVMADYAGENAVVFASLASIADRSSCSRDTVRRTIVEACEVGWLEELDPSDSRVPAEYRALRQDRRPRVYRFTGSRDARSHGARSQRGSNGVATGSRQGATQTKNREHRTEASSQTGVHRPWPRDTSEDVAWSVLDVDDDGNLWARRDATIPDGEVATVDER